MENVHSAAKSPLMLMDPMDYTHNISAKISDDSIKLLNGLIRNALFIVSMQMCFINNLNFQLKQKIFRVSLLLRTNHTANMLMRNKDSHTCMTTNKLPAALSQFASVCSGHQEYLTFQLPDLVQTSEEFMLLLTRILRFDVSPDHEGPSVNNLYNSMVSIPLPKLSKMFSPGSGICDSRSIVDWSSEQETTAEARKTGHNKSRVRGVVLRFVSIRRRANRRDESRHVRSSGHESENRLR